MKKKEMDLTEKKLEIFDIWDNKGVKFAIIELKKLYMKLYNKLDIHGKNTILYNLICAEYENGDIESVKIHSEQLKEDMDNEIGYKDIFAFSYAKLLTYYRDSHDLTYEEELEIDNFYYNLYKEYSDPRDEKYLDYLNSKFNLNLFLKDYKAVLKVIKDMLYIKNNTTEYCSLYKQMLDDIRNKSLDLYSEVQELESQYKVCNIG